MHSPLSEVSESGRVGRYSDFWLRTYASPSPLFRVVIRGFVASYSSATVAEFHGVPCANARHNKSKNYLGRYWQTLSQSVMAKPYACDCRHNLSPQGPMSSL
jgi:hypothetical protein